MSQYETRDLETVSYLLDINVDYSEQNIKLLQKLYIEKLLSEYNINECKTNECKTTKTPVKLRYKNYQSMIVLQTILKEKR